MTEKFCPKCKKVKSTDDFYKQATRKDGFRAWCKQCDLAWKHSEKGQEASRRYGKSDKRREANKRHSKTESFKSRHSKTTKFLKEKHPEKVKARYAVLNATRRGKLPKVKTLTCSFPECNKQAQEYHHYLGYNPEYWLEVKPYCSIHHREVDKANCLHYLPTS